jgi:hypothetical protein
MKDVMDLIFEYRRLLARRDLMATELSDQAVARLSALDRLFAGGAAANDESSGRRRHARVEVNVPATVRIDGRIHPVTITNIGGGGVCVEPAPQMKQGERAIIRIVSGDSERIYQYEVEASWIDRTPERSAVGMPFVGIPRELPMAAKAS